MGVTRPYTIKTESGESKVVYLMECVNAARTPQYRDKILAGTFHRFLSDDGKTWFTVDKPFFYCDFGRHQFFLVYPRGDRHRWKDVSAKLERMVSDVPDFISAKKNRIYRVVFGLGELREKLVASDAGIDDKMLELLKVFILHEHPVLMSKVRMRLTLEEVDHDNLRFSVCYDHYPRKYKIFIQRDKANTILHDQKDELMKWVATVHPRSNIFNLKNDHWINVWRWSPSPTVLDRLKQTTQKIQNHEKVDPASKEFQSMLKYLPRGSQLPSWAKKDLTTLFTWAKTLKNQKLQGDILEVRFDKEIEDDWYVNKNVTDIDTLWNLFSTLPPSNIEGNTDLREILLDSGDGGGTYDPSTHDVNIGEDELRNKEGFEDTVRHEVGHAVHEMMEKKVNAFLYQQFGWQTFGTNDRDIDRWVALMGGYGHLTDKEKREVRSYLRHAAEKSPDWGPPSIPVIDPDHAWFTVNFMPRLSVERTGANWYALNTEWARKNGKAFLVNCWYQNFMVVNASTLDLINEKMPSNYAAQSPLEFFAELYALYYDYDNPKRKNISKEAAKWLNENVGRSKMQKEVKNEKIKYSPRPRPGKPK